MLNQALDYDREIGDCNNIRISREDESISLFIPSTTNLDYISNYFEVINEHFGDTNILVHKARGAWYFQGMKKIVTEATAIIEVELGNITDLDIEYMKSLGLSVKKELNQELLCLV